MANNNSIVIPPRVKDLTGQAFGRLTVLGYAGKNKRRFSMWTCRCECGLPCVVQGTSLTRSATRSCGCLQRNTVTARNMKHGLSRSPEFTTWHSMFERCNNPRNKAYAHYGGRGISVCDRWSAFETFYEDMGPRPSPNHSIDRIDNAKGYCKVNCRWATQTTQNRNSRRNRVLTFNGKAMCLSEWSEQLSISIQTLHSRLRRGWSVERALTTPL